MTATSILCALSFLCFAFLHVGSHPNREPSNYQDDVGDFRSLSTGQLPAADEFDDLKDDEYDADDLYFDDEDDSDLEYGSITNNKRSPNTATFATYRNSAGYYLIEGPGHSVTGTTDITTCNNKGVFQFGKTHGVPFIRNKSSHWYLAIGDNGDVYMSPNQTADTAIRHYLVGRNAHLYLYRKLKHPTRFLYLDISPESSTVQQSAIANTSDFVIRIGKLC